MDGSSAGVLRSGGQCHGEHRELRARYDHSGSEEKSWSGQGRVWCSCLTRDQPFSPWKEVTLPGWFWMTGGCDCSVILRKPAERTDRGRTVVRQKWPDRERGKCARRLPKEPPGHERRRQSMIQNKHAFVVWASVVSVFFLLGGKEWHRRIIRPGPLKSPFRFHPVGQLIWVHVFWRTNGLNFWGSPW